MSQRIRGRRLQERRERYRTLQPLCVKCLERGRYRPWTQLDHVIALTNGGEDTGENSQGLCDECHAEKTALDLGHRRKQQIGPDGFPVDG